MSNDKAKACLVLIHEGEVTTVYTAFRGLLKAEIENLREANDAAAPEDVLRNQGAISRLKHLLKVTAPKREFQENEMSA